MGLLDKIESVLPGHNNTDADKEHTGLHGDTTHTESATGEHATSTHPHLGHSHHGTAAHTTEHTTGLPVTTSTIHDDHLTSTAHDGKLGTTPVVSSFTEHQAPTSQTTITPAATTSSHIAGSKLDGSADHTSDTLPPLAGSVLTGHPASHQDIHSSKIGGSGGTIEHDTSKHTASGLFGHRDHTTSTPHDAHKTESGVSGLMHKLTGSHSSGHQHETTHTDAGHHTTGVSSTAEHTSSQAPHTIEKTTTTATPATTAGQALSSHDQAHEGTKFIPNAENPSAIPTAGGRVIGAGQVDHNATGTIGKEYPGDKAFTSGSGATEHAGTGSTIVTTGTSTVPVKDGPLPDRTASGTTSTTHST